MQRSRSASAAATFLLAALVLPASSATGAAPARATSTTTTLTISVPQSAYGQTVTATAVVSSTGGTPEGDVVIAVDGVAKKVNLSATGTASLVLPRALVGEHATSATYVPFGPAHAGSSSPTQVWTVAQVRTRLQVRVIGKGARIPTSVRVGAAGDYGTQPAGRVRFVLRRTADGKRVVSAERLDGAAAALVGLGTLRKGRYRLEVTYVGDSQHLRERQVETFRVRQR